MNRLSFKTHAQLKSIIGRDLINNDNIAVLELVKNSYDAASKKADVIFKNLKENDDDRNDSYSDKSSKIFIIDDGIGMDDEDIKEKWLNIAFSDKKHEKRKDGRVFAGVKGIGRFSCDRLGQYLDLYTKKQGKPIYHLFIDWKTFEVEDEKDLKIQDVEIQFETITRQDFQEKFGFPFEQGTILEMSKLRSKWAIKEPKKETRKKENKVKWNTSKILDLRRYLEKLINPNQAFGSIRFTIELFANDFEKEDALKKNHLKLNGVIENKIFEKLNFTTTVIETGISKGGDTITTILTDKGRKVFEVIEKNVEYSLLKDITIVIFYLNPYAKAYFKRHTGIRSIDFGSIFLFINGFRVNPLGDYGDDWLRMEIRKGQGYAKFLGSREVVGRIEINDFDGNFKIISSREGVVKDQKFSQIVNIRPTHYGGFFYKTLKRLEKYVVEGLNWDKTSETGHLIEKWVDGRNWKYDPADEKYVENESIKNERILGLLSSLVLVETRPGDILKLYINEELISRLLHEQKEKARDKFNKFFGEKALYARDILDEATWAALNKIRGELEQKERVLAKKEQEIRILQETKEKLEENLGKEKEKIKYLKKETLAQKKQIYFQERHLDVSTDYTQVVNLHHQIGISASTINGHLANLREEVEDGKFNKESLREYIEDLSFECNKIKAITDMAIQARFNAASPELKKENLTQFIIQYITGVSKTTIKTFDEKEMKIRLDTSRVIANFISNFNSIEVVMLFDNLFNNSRKARAKIINVEIESFNNELDIRVKDDGIGIPPGNREKIFTFGFSTTHGTGLGLFHARKILNKMGGKIVLNEKFQEGCEFVIMVKK